MGLFDGKKPPGEKKDEKKAAAKPPFAAQARKPEPDLIETVLTDTIFGKVKLSTSYFKEKKKLKLVFKEITELPDCVKTIIPHVEGDRVEGVYRIFMGNRQVCTKVVTDAKGKSRVEKALEIPVVEFIPSFMITPEEKDELAEILKYTNEKAGLHFELAKLTTVESINVREKLGKARVLFKGAKVRYDFDLKEFSGRIKEVLQTAEGNTYILVVEKRNDKNKEDSFLLIERGKINVDEPEHLLKVENLIDLGAQFTGMERSHIMAMGQKSLVVECDDGCIAMIMPIAKKESLSQTSYTGVNPAVKPPEETG